MSSGASKFSRAGRRRLDPGAAAAGERRGTDLDYAFVANEEMAFAARKAFDRGGGEKVKIVTVNGTDEALAALKDGRFAATVSNSAKDTGVLAVTNAISLLRGGRRRRRSSPRRPA
ncbi:substrate-binding domain-containing protein [Streptomyces sp. NPDC096057]|uniref:substrate-binding domain-containing protein n=1 Tax=Streptomyces sp. NPDC096057 TaxID=3155543 RepID=UPI0033286074